MQTKWPGLWLLVASLALLLCAAQAVVAEGNGTLNLRSGAIYKGPHVAWGEARFWEGDGNESFAVGVLGQVSDRWDGNITFLDMGIRGEDPIGGVVRESSLQLLAFDARRQLFDGNYKVTVNPGLELVPSHATGRNTATDAVADWGDVIWTCGLACERTYGSWTWIFNPRLAAWRESVTASNDQEVDGFGTVVGLGLGVRRQMSSRLLLTADWTAIVSGENTLDEDTNELDREAVWGVSATYRLPRSRDCWLTIFTSNAFGPTPATALLAVPGNSLCFGARAATSF